MAGLLFLVLLAALNEGVLGDEAKILQSTCTLSQNAIGGAVAPNTCALSEVPASSEGEFRCLDVEWSPDYCPHDTLFKEGSLCVHSLDQQLAFECRSGKWTRTDTLAHRQKRFFGIFVALGVGIAALATAAAVCSALCKESKRQRNKAPSISCPADRTVTASSGEVEARVTWKWPTGYDAEDGPPRVQQTSGPSSGSLFQEGTTLVAYRAEDSEGLSALCSFKVTVRVIRCNPRLMTPTNGHSPKCSGAPGHDMYGSTCNFTCFTGHELVGAESLTCQSSGSWTGLEPVCKVVTCPNLPTVEAGYWNCTNNKAFQSQCSLSCHDGYTAQSPTSITCSAEGNWSAPGTCLDTERPGFIGCPNNMEVFASRLGETTTANWTEPVVSDNSGETIVPTSDITSGSSFPVGVTYVTYRASDSSNNTYLCSFSVTVTTLSCGQPDFEDPARNRSLMLYDCPDGYVHGAVCMLNCTSGYPLLGADAATCERNDNQYPPKMFWNYNGTKPECKENDCPPLDEPRNGAMSCLLGNFGWDCLMSCNNNFDVMASFDGKFICTNSEGYWRPPVVPDCIASHDPNNAKLPSALYYYNDTCPASLDEIRGNFIEALRNSQWRDACVNVPTCTPGNVQVTCGPETGRRRRSADGVLWEDNSHDRRRRQTQQVITISFDLVMGYAMNGTAEETYQAYKAKEEQVWTALKQDAANGVFDIGSLTPDPENVVYPALTFDCPAGTKFERRSTITKASCVGCSKGSYLRASSGDCVQCEKGHYTELDTATSCTPCPAGQSTLSQGADNRTLCRDQCTAGHFSPTGLAPCQPCPPGSYQSRDQALTCDLCPSGTWTYFAASVSRDDCVATDVHLTTNATLRGTITSTQTSMTGSVWLRLSANSSAVVSISHNETGYPLRILTVTEYAEDGMSHWNSYFAYPPAAVIEVAQDKWRQLVVVLTNGTEVAFFIDQKSFKNLTLPRALTTVTSAVELLMLRGTGTVSGLRAEARAMTQGEISQSFSSCTGDYSSNMISWTPRPSSVRLPSSCGVDGGWGNWTDWTSCSATCGGGETTRSRQCNNPRPQNGGAPCVGESREEKFCGTGVCPVHGGFSSWTAWTPCSVTCDEGTQSRERSCDNPVPANGGNPCSGPTNETRLCNLATCPVCRRLARSEGTDFNCTHSLDPDRLTCRVVCELGYSSPLINAEYMCGLETGYRWTFEGNGTNGTDPYCTKIKTARSAQATTRVPYNNTDCSQKDAIASQVQENLRELPCALDHICTVKTKAECVTGGGGGSAAAVVDVAADFGDSITYDPNDNASMIEYAKKFLSVDYSVAMVAINDTETLFTVTLDDVIVKPDVSDASYSAFVSCPPGAISEDGGCVDCPKGFYEESGQCKLCPLGQYQDEEASTSCKPCPDDLTSDVRGATDVTQCQYRRSDANSTVDTDGSGDTRTPSTSENRGFLIAGILGGFIGVALVVASLLVIIRIMKGKRGAKTSPDTHVDEILPRQYDNKVSGDVMA